jgi:hypothetical protein
MKSCSIEVEAIERGTRAFNRAATLLNYQPRLERSAMDYYFSAADDGAALRANQIDGGPVPGCDDVDSVEAKDICPCPHLEQLVAFSTGKTKASLVPELKCLWPDASAWMSVGEEGPPPSISRVPDSLRDDLAEIDLSPALAERWSEELWGYDSDGAQSVGERVVQLARRARAQNKSLYWWCEV